MFYECAISPEALFEIAIDRRNYRDFIKGLALLNKSDFG